MTVSKSKFQVIPGESDLGHGHGAVALVVSKLGLLVGRQGQRRVFQFGERRPDSQVKNLLEPLVDVEHGVTTASPLLLQRLRTHIKSGCFLSGSVHRNCSLKSRFNGMFSPQHSEMDVLVENSEELIYSLS